MDKKISERKKIKSCLKYCFVPKTLQDICNTHHRSPFLNIIEIMLGRCKVLLKTWN